MESGDRERKERHESGSLNSICGCWVKRKKKKKSTLSFRLCLGEMMGVESQRETFDDDDSRK